MIRGQGKTTIHVSVNWRRGGWSSWAASPASTQSVAATSGMMRELGPGTMGLDIYPGVQQEIIPGFFKNGSRGHYHYLLLSTFVKFLFGYVLSVDNVIVVMAVSSLEKGIINRNIGKEILNFLTSV